MKDILDFEMNFEYPFLGLTAIKDANPMSAVNYSNPSALEPLQVKKMLPSSAIRWKYPEMLYPLGAEHYLLPWYFSERDIVWNDARTKDPQIKITAAEHFTTPVIRSGVRLAGLDEFFDMDVKDQLFNLDVMVRTPGTTEHVKGGVYKYAQDGDGIPFILANDDVIEELTVDDYMSTPRQLGWFFMLPGSVSIPTRASEDQANFFDNEFTPAYMCDAGTSFVATMYKGGFSPSAAPNAILGNGTVNVNRAQAFTQNWTKRYADGKATVGGNFDLMLSIRDGISATEGAGDVNLEAVDAKTAFRPFTYGPYNRNETNIAEEILGSLGRDKLPKLFSIMRGYWASIQKLPFIINPFAGYAEKVNASEGNADPFDLAYLFGLAGFVAANYYEEQYNRANQILQQGYGYTSDPITIQSPVFKDGYRTVG